MGVDNQLLYVNAHLLNGGTQRTFGCLHVSPSAPSVGAELSFRSLAKEGDASAGAKGKFFVRRFDVSGR